MLPPQDPSEKAARELAHVLRKRYLMKPQTRETNPTKSRRRRTSKRANASLEETVALGGEYLRTVTSGSYDDDDSPSAELGGFHFFGLN